MVNGYRIGACSVLLIWSSSLLADDSRAIEEIIVTAQRVEENSQQVPIALNAYSDVAIRDRRIIGIADLAINVPSLSYNTNNVGDGHVSIRGVGSLVSVTNADPGVALHVNEAPLPPGQPPLHIFDLERIEVLRGPQSTLYGRNATGGVINLLTKKPSFDGHGGFVDIESGDYDLFRARGAVNLTPSDRFAVRVAGMTLNRSGYTDNLAGGQVPGVSGDLDDRDLWAVRLTTTWRPTEATEFRLMYEEYQEDDRRMITHNRRCKTAVAPVTRTGCEPGQFGLEAHNPNQARVNTAIANGLLGVTPLGARDADSGLEFRYPRPAIQDLREVHLDGETAYELDQELWQLNAVHTLDWGSFHIVGSYQEWDTVNAWDEDWGVGHELAAIPENPSGLWPVSWQPPDSFPPEGPVCDVSQGLGGALGGCVLDPNTTRQSWNLGSIEEQEFYSLELRFRSDFDGPLNVLFGLNVQDSEVSGAGFGGTNDFHTAFALTGTHSVTNPAADPYGIGVGSVLINVLGPSQGKRRFQSESVFSELYFEFSDRLKLTVAARYNRDEKQISERGSSGSFDANALFGGAFGETLWVRGAAAQYALGVSSDSSVLDLYGLTEAVDLARSQGGPLAAVQAAAQVPLLTIWNESRVLAGVPSSFDWEAVSGRVVLDWQFSDNTLLYGSFARGYKPGGFNGPGSANLDYEREDVNSYEVGFKSIFADRTLSVNAAAFFNDYENLHLTNLSLEQFSRSIENTNVDADMYGAELEVRWQPFFAPRAEIEMSYSWLQSKFRGEAPRIDPLWLTNGDAAYVELMSFVTNAGSATGRYVARVSDVLPLMDAAIAAGAAIGPADAPAAIYPNGIPGWFDGLFLLQNGVEIQPGIEIPINGNRIPDSPEHTLHVGTSYSWDVPNGTLTARYDYYWQSNSYLTVFNRSVESTGSWDQHNLSVNYEAVDGRWSVQGWVRNIGDDVHILGGYRAHSAQSFSVTEPRTWGVSLRYNFGVI